MAKKLFYMLLLFLSIRVCAQRETIHSMLEDGKSWNYEYHHYEESEEWPPTETVFPVSYTISGDTLIDNKSYYKMYKVVDNQRSYYAAYREEGLNVYQRFPLIRPEYEEDFIVADFEYEGLYDLNGSGDNDPYSTIKEYIDYIEVNGVRYRRHTYYEEDKDKKLAIGVEGIGYLNGLNYPSIYGPEPDCICDYQVFTSCELNGLTIFHAKDFYAPSIKGDVNGDGKIDIVDATSAISYILGQMPTPFNEAAADINGDGEVDTVDVTSVIDIILTDDNSSSTNKK